MFPGKGLGSIITGYLIQRLDFRWMWRVFSGSSVAILLIYVGLNCCVFTSHSQHKAGKSGQNTSESVTSDPSRYANQIFCLR